MMRSSERTGVLARFGAGRRRISMKRTVTTIVFCLAALVILAAAQEERDTQTTTLSTCLRRWIRLPQKTCTPRWQSVNSARPPT